MKKSTKTPKNFYRVRLLHEFDLLKSREAMQEVLEYARFIKQLEKLDYQQNKPPIKIQ